MAPAAARGADGRDAPVISVRVPPVWGDNARVRTIDRSFSEQAPALPIDGVVGHTPVCFVNYTVFPASSIKFLVFSSFFPKSTRVRATVRVLCVRYGSVSVAASTVC
jgi:hypothetical protein